jgi:hypothetical protein
MAAFVAKQMLGSKMNAVKGILFQIQFFKYSKIFFKYLKIFKNISKKNNRFGWKR